MEINHSVALLLTLQNTKSLIMTNLEQSLASLQMNIKPFENTVDSINENELILSGLENTDEIDYFLNDSFNNREHKVKLVLQSKKKQKELILNELSEISRLLNKYNIQLGLIDYTIPFYYDEQEHSSFFESKNTLTEEVLAYFLHSKYTDESLSKIEKDLIKEDAFFGLDDVLRVKGKFRYKVLIKETKALLKELELYDSKGNITELGREIKASLQQKHINTERATKSKGEACYRIGITKSSLEREIVELFV